MTWSKGGSKPLLMYALPHHVAAFTRATTPNITSMRLQTTTKGMATAILADAWQMNETTFGIFDTFEDENGRDAHLNGKIAGALMEHADELLSEPPKIEKVDILAAK